MNNVDITNNYKGDIKALEASKYAFYLVKDDIFSGKLRYLLDKVSIGLVGAGSECYGYDDKISADHDWGIGFCIWMDSRDYEEFGKEIYEKYVKFLNRKLSDGDLKMRIRRAEESFPRRIGPLDYEKFYQAIFADFTYPKTYGQWLSVRESDLSMATNGSVFIDNNKSFSSIREHLLAYYPEDILYKKLSYHVFFLGQMIQYNFFRALDRGEFTTARRIYHLSLDHLISIVFILNREYRPYYKWELRKLRELKTLGREVYDLISNIAFASSRDSLVLKREYDEKVKSEYFPIIVQIMEELKGREISCESYSLIEYSKVCHDRIKDESLRATDIMRI